MTSFQNLSLVPYATARETLDGTGLRPVVGTRGNSTVMLRPFSNWAYQEHFQKVQADIKATCAAGIKVLYVEPFRATGYEWYEINCEGALDALRERLGRHDILLRADAIPDKSIPPRPQVERIDVVSHLRLFPEMYRKWLVGITHDLPSYMLDPMGEINALTHEHQRTGRFSGPDEKIRPVARKLLFDCTHEATIENRNIAVFSPYGVIGDLAEDLHNNDDFTFKSA